MSIVGLMGYRGAGKDTAARYLVEQYGFTAISFATRLKDALSAIFGFDRDDLEGDTPERRERRAQVDPFWSEFLDIEDFSPLKALTMIGTDTMREHFHNDVWVGGVIREIHTLLNAGKPVVVTDLRYWHEYIALDKLGVRTVRIHRELPEFWKKPTEEYFNAKPEDRIKLFDHYAQNDIPVAWRAGVHDSAYTFLDLPTSMIFDNNLDVNHLYRQIDRHIDILKAPAWSSSDI